MYCTSCIRILCLSTTEQASFLRFLKPVVEGERVSLQDVVQHPYATLEGCLSIMHDDAQSDASQWEVQ